MAKHLTTTLLVAVLLLVTGGLSVQAATGDLQLVTSSENRPLSSFDHDNVIYFSLSELSEVLGGRLDWTIVGHEITYVVNDRSFEFLIGAPFFKVGDRIYNQTFPALFREGQLFLPASTFVPFLDGVVAQSVTYHKLTNQLRIDSEYFNVVDLAIDAKANGLLIEILLTGQLSYDIFVTEGNWLNVTITDARINTSRILAAKDRRYMYKLTTHQAVGSGQVSMRLKRPITKWHHKLAYDPPRIQIVITDVNFDLEPEDTTPTIVGPDDKIDVIVIDPGHGGSDYGAIGTRGTREKDVVLSIGRELAKLLRKDKQFKVVMTRDRDKYVDLDQRAAVANDAGADLFISLHANASPSRKPRGWNVFFLAPARNDSARSVAQFENSFFLKELTNSATEVLPGDDPDTDPILGILNEMIMTEFQEESHDFALMVAKEFNRRLDIPARGVDQAAFFVLNGVFTTSVLLETGFISNKTEEKLLKSDKYQRKVAEAVYNAIKRFKAQYEKEAG